MQYTPEFNSKFGALGVEISNLWPESTALKRNGKSRDTLGGKRGQGKRGQAT